MTWLLLVLAVEAPAQPGKLTWHDPPPPMLDADPLPRGARARLQPASRSTSLQAISPDGSLLATAPVAAGGGYPLRVWHTATGKNVRFLPGHEMAVLSSALSPDNKLLASAGMDDRLRLWDLDTGKPIGNYLHNGHVHSVCFSPGGKLLASASRNSIRFWDTGKREELPRFYPPAGVDSEFFFHVLISPDGKFLASASDRAVRLWDLATGKQTTLGAAPSRPYLGFSQDGRTLFVHLHGKENIDKLNLKTGKSVTVAKVPTTPLTLDFSPQGLLAWSKPGERQITVRDLNEGRDLPAILSPSPVRSLRFTADGAKLAVNGDDGSVRLWEPTKGKVLHTAIEPVHVVVGLDFAKDGKSVKAFTQDGLVCLWDLASRKGSRRCALPLPPGSSVLRLSPDGRILIAADAEQRLLVCEAETGARLATTAALAVPAARATVTVAADSRSFAALVNRPTPLKTVDGIGPVKPRDPAKDDARLVVWDLHGKELQRPKLPAATSSFALRDERTFVTGEWVPARDPQKPCTVIRIAELATGKETARFTPAVPPATEKRFVESTDVPAVHVSPDGRILAAVEETVVRIPAKKKEDDLQFASFHLRVLDLTSAKELNRMPTFHFPAVSFSATGRYLSWTAAPEESVGVGMCDLDKGRLSMSPPAHDAFVACLAFSRDNQMLLSAAEDGSMMLWDVGQMLK